MRRSPTSRLRGRIVSGMAVLFAAAILAAPGTAQTSRADRSQRAQPEAWIGISVSTAIQIGRTQAVAAAPTPEGAEYRVLVSAVEPGGPAYRSGLRSGDVLLRMDDRSIRVEDFHRRMTSAMPGETVHLAYQRAGVIRDAVIHLEPRPEQRQAPQGEFTLVFMDTADSGDWMDASQLHTTHIRIGIDSVSGEVRMISGVGDGSLIRIDSPGDPMTVFSPRGAGEMNFDIRRMRGADGAVTLDTMFVAGADSIWVSFYGFEGASFDVLPMWPGAEIELEGGLTRIRTSRGEEAALLPTERTEIITRRGATLEGVVRVETIDPTGVERRSVARTRFLAAPTVVGRNVVAGAELTELRAELYEFFGADEGILVTEVLDGTPAESAGLRGGDVIARVNGVPVATVSAFRTALAESRPVRILVIRKGETVSLELGR